MSRTIHAPRAGPARRLLNAIVGVVLTDRISRGLAESREYQRARLDATRIGSGHRG